MAVGSFMKSSGIVALALGLAITLPAAASAQERGGGLFQRQEQAAPQTQPSGEARPQWRQRERAQAEPRTQAQTQAQPQWQGNRGGDGARSWRRDNPQAGTQRDTQRQGWNGTNRRQDTQRNNWSGNQTRGDAARRWDNDRNDSRADNNRWQGNSNRWNGNNTRRWNNNWRRDNRYDWSGYRNSNRDVFRMGRYSAPYRNWSYRRLGIGFRLQPLFYSNNYWINDPGYYRLPEAYGPYRWVRYYDDALLVDIYTGEVVDVINNFFW